MNIKQTKIVLAIVACLVSSICTSFAHAKASEKESILRICDQLFGKSVDEKQNLFEVNQFYVLRVKFNRNELEELAVEPKYYFEETHPEWEEPDNFTYLSQTEHENLLARLDDVKPKGALIKPDYGGGLVTNMTSRHKAVYVNAVLEWGEVVDLRRGENAPLAIKWIRLNYLKSKPRETGR
jgi:hypothetical protein